MTLPESAKSTLSSLVEAHLTSLVREAACVQRHAKRARFHPTNCTSAFASSSTNPNGTEQQHQQQQHEHEQQGVLRRRLAAEDINLALQWRGSEKLYATSIVVPDVHVSMEKDQRNVDLHAYLRNENQARAPSEMGLTTHWLAVDGTQPYIVENPALRSSIRGGGGGRQLPHRIQRDDDDDENENDHRSTSQDTTHAASSKNNHHPSGVSVRQLLPRVLSEELQLYFTRMTLAMERGGATATTRRHQDAALSSLSRDAGVHELVPFLVRYMTKQLYQHLNEPEHCRTLIRMARSLLSNPHVHLELHLHQLLPALVTCTVAEHLAPSPAAVAASTSSTNGASDSDGNAKQPSQVDNVPMTMNHWALRTEAAETLLQACNMFGDEYVTLKARVLKTFCEAIAPDKALTTQYGGIVAITFFGPKAIDAFLLPVAMTYWEAWERALEKMPPTASSSTASSSTGSTGSVTGSVPDMARRQEIQQCQQAMMNAMAVFLERVSPKDQAERVERQKLVDVFGEKIVPLENELAEYAMCVV